MKILYLVPAIFLAGCSAQQAPAPIAVETPRVVYQKPRPLVLNRYQWKVYDAADLEKLAKSKDAPVLYALTPEGYKALTANIVELQRYIRQQKELIIVLRRTINPPKQEK